MFTPWDHSILPMKIYSEKMITHVHNGIHRKMFIGALYLLEKIENNLNVQKQDISEINQYIHTVDYWAVFKNDHVNCIY